MQLFYFVTVFKKEIKNKVWHKVCIVLIVMIITAVING